MKTRFFLILCALAVSVSLPAQKRKAKPAKAKVEVKAPNPGLELYKSMISSTAKLLFVDSVVVVKNDFIRHIPLNRESGRIAMRDSMFSLYENELADRRYITDGDTAKSAIYTQDFIGGDWTAPKKVVGSSKNFPIANYPFLMADGVTLYFGAQGEESMGGYDLFMTTFDRDNGTFYTPENMGLPYNSTANDYMLAIDDVDTLGWLVTDRRQPEGKVCIYTFVPTPSRIGFDGDMTDKEIEPYGRILKISDSWKFGDRKAALARIANLKQRNQTDMAARAEISLIPISDNIVYTSGTQFKSPRAYKLYMQLVTKRQSLQKGQYKLEAMRMEYHNADRQEKRKLAPYISEAEAAIEQQQQEIAYLEKTIRNIEIEHIGGR